MTEEYITVSKLNQWIKMLFDDTPYFKKVYLKGEISNFKHHTSGHLYFTLKDEESRINAIMFKSAASTLNFVPEDGMNVLVCGRISVYPAGGNYQIYVDKMDQDGLGNLYIEFEKLKKKLQSEGLFDPSHKKPIPKYPTKVGIITAPTGAAIKDILSTIQRRFPICETILFPSLVQGALAAQDVARNILLASKYDLDVLIVGRGGGSIEDLWAFNEEIVARAIYECPIPVISAVGHEVDVTISDYVADKRAPTPTGAAEMAVPVVEDVKNLFKTKEIEISSLLQKKLGDATHTLKKLSDAYVLKNPMVLYETKIQKLDGFTEDIRKSMNQFIENKKASLLHLKDSFVLQNPRQLYGPRQKELETKIMFLQNYITTILNEKRKMFGFAIERLNLVNPLNLLEKGYSLVQKDGHIIKNSHDLNIHDQLHIQLSKGKVDVEVKEIFHE